MKKLIPFLILVALNCVAISQTTPKFPKTTLTNRVTFNDSKFNNPLAGCAFLIDVGFDTLAVTCKHALWVAKSDQMTGIDFSGTLKEWRMQRKDDTTQYLIVDKLINTDKEELIGDHNVEKDWLIFTIKENKSDVVPLRIYTGELSKGDTLYHIGWSFKNKTGAQRVHTSIYQKNIPNHILADWISKPADDHGGGLSGSPYMTESLELVAITSGWAQDPETQKWYPSPCSTDYLWEILYMYWLEKYPEYKKSSFPEKEFVKMISKYYGYEIDIPKNIMPTAFAKDVISTNNLEFSQTFADSGSLVYFTRRNYSVKDSNRVYYSKYEDGNWSIPKKIKISSNTMEYCPNFIVNTNELFFLSKRSDINSNPKLFKYKASSQNTPIEVIGIINTMQPKYFSISEKQTILFSRFNESGLFISYPEKNTYPNYQKLNFLKGNLQSLDHAFLAPDESYIIFDAINPESKNKDLYIIFSDNGKWSEPIRLSESINTPYSEACPGINPYNNKLYFTRFTNTESAIYEKEFDISLLNPNKR